MEKSSLNYVQIPKTPTEKLTLYQRFQIFGRKSDAGNHIPAKTVL